MMSTYRVVLDYRVDQELAKRWSVTDTPGIALVGARGQLLTSHSGYVTREILLAFSKSAGAQAAGGP
jgi:hypothetical protein